MTDVYELWDHRCPALETFLVEKKVRFQGGGCWCSPMERHYQVFEDGEWKDIDECPFCNELMTPFEVLWASDSPYPITGYVKCPECGHKFKDSYFRYK